MKLSREEIDNPHKPKTWNAYHEDFAIELYFTESNTMLVLFVGLVTTCRFINTNV